MAAATMMATATTTAKRRKPVYDDEKAGRLIRVYGSIVWFCLLLCWLEIMILRPSISIGIEMVRQFYGATIFYTSVLSLVLVLTNSICFVFLCLLFYIPSTTTETYGSYRNYWCPISFGTGVNLYFVTGIDLNDILDGRRPVYSDMEST